MEACDERDSVLDCSGPPALSNVLSACAKLQRAGALQNAHALIVPKAKPKRANSLAYSLYGQLSSYTSFKDHGFWSRDALLELSLKLLAYHLPKDSTF